MRMTIFARILLATLLPLALVFSLVVATISNIIYTNSTAVAKEAASRKADYMSLQISDKLDNMAGYLSIVSQAMSEVPRDYSHSRGQLDALTQRLIMADSTFLCAWFAIEPGVLPGTEHTQKTFVRQNGIVYEADEVAVEELRDPEKSPWYTSAIKSGKLSQNLIDEYDYGVGSESGVAIAMTIPIFAADQIIGAAGIDIYYTSLLNSEVFEQGDDWRTLLVAENGKILYSTDKELERYSSRNLFDIPFSNLDSLKAAMAGGHKLLEEAYSPLANANSLISLSPIRTIDPSQRIYLYLSTPVKDVYAVARSSMELIISTSLLGLVLLGFSVFAATRNIVRPIKQLTVNFDKVSRGDLAAVSKKETANARSTVEELDILQTSLRKMLEEVHQAHDLRIKATEERVERERLLAISEAKTSFLANMSHEIRTPMNAILGIAQILLHNNSLSEQERKYIHDIKISSEALVTIINDILDISKLESGKLTLEECDFNFHELLENMLAMGEYLVAPNSLEFIHTYDEALPVCLYGDDVRLRQILLNLISNACKFTSEGSVSFSVAMENSFLRFIVADTGSGISAEEMESLFEPFKRLDTTRNRKIQGTGLGLSICKNLVDLMGGSIRVVSEYGRGTSFTVLLPLVTGDEKAMLPSGNNERTEYDPRVRVLVVDDNEINLSVAQGLLVDLYGVACDLADSGAKALELIVDNEYTLVFMDHMMPEMDGIETTQRIRVMGGRFAQIPIIALTANAVKGTREVMLASGIDDYLTKPIKIEELEGILNRWIPDGLKVGKTSG